jgi:hypothetical protein
MSTIKTNFKNLNTEIEAVFDKLYLKEDINGRPCLIELTKIAKYHSAILLADMIKNNITLNAEFDWKTEFSYTNIKECLSCDNIDFDAILTTSGVSL